MASLQQRYGLGEDWPGEICLGALFQNSFVVCSHAIQKIENKARTLSLEPLKQTVKNVCAST
ncbi:MAG: hypothetical protein QM674_07175 [Burkholderiaceae bacterium]